LGDITDAEKKQTPPKLLMRLMDVREKLEAFTETKNTALKTDLIDESTTLQTEQQAIDDAIDRLMTTFDNAATPDAKRASLIEIRQLMLKKNYLRSLIDTIQTELNPSDL
jgi:predicted nuclease with TOPRIM domain